MIRSSMESLGIHFLMLFLCCIVVPEIFLGCYAASQDYAELRSKRQACDGTPTEANGKHTCKGKLIFEDNFDGPVLDSRRWVADNQLAGDPDYEFTWFTDNEKNLFLRDGLIFLKPTLISTKNNFLTSGTLDLKNKGCTGIAVEECFLQATHFNILPPVASARIRSKGKFSFKYGIVEIRAKLPDGFWLYPEMYLEPVEPSYGNYSGRVILAFSRGNARLITGTGEDVGSRRLIGGLELGMNEPARSHAIQRKDLPVREAWNADFHVFRFIWKPTEAKLEVDGKILQSVKPPRSGFSSQLQEGSDWSKGDRMAPFDKEFYITLGLGVGGIRAFPDGTSSADKAKPWKNNSVKAKLQFLTEKVTWRDTWAFDDAALQVDYVRVWAL